MEVTLDGHRYRLRTDLQGSAYAAFAAAGVRPPPVVTPLGPDPACQRKPRRSAKLPIPSCNSSESRGPANTTVENGLFPDFVATLAGTFLAIDS